MSSVAWLSSRMEDGRILCEACAQECKLQDGEYGLCAIRKVENGELTLLTYGIAAAVTIDTAQKQPMVSLDPNTRVLSLGTIGCNFSCTFCQNYDLSQYPKENNHKIDGRRLSPRDMVALAIKYDCECIAYTYNEPATYFEYCYDTAKLAHAAGLKNIYVTSGFETRKAIDMIAPYIDVMIIDLKAFSESFYSEICGAALQPVLDTIRYVHGKKIPIEITTPLIPTHNDSDEDIRMLSEFLTGIDPSIPWHVLPFKPMYKMLDVPMTSDESLQRALHIGKTQGLESVYIRNECEEHHKSACHHGCA